MRVLHAACERQPAHVFVRVLRDDDERQRSAGVVAALAFIPPQQDCAVVLYALEAMISGTIRATKLSPAAISLAWPVLGVPAGPP